MTDFAILAPVPAEHLASGLDLLSRESFVAFGSLKWELFEKIDLLRNGKPVPVLVYPSGEQDAVSLAFVIQWKGWYQGHVRSVGGAHPDGMRYRPDSVRAYPTDMAGYWAVFWHVSDLQQLAEADHRPISSLQSYRSGKFWKAGHPPRGPEVVARPSWV